MFGFIKRWMERRRRKAILKDIKKAKNLYIRNQEWFMCICFSKVDYWKYTHYDMIRQRIPEFKPETFNVDPSHINGAWWVPRDRDSRIKAFDKLIEIYSD